MNIEYIKQCAFEDELDKLAALHSIPKRLRRVLLQFKKAVVAQPMYRYKKVVAQRPIRTVKTENKSGSMLDDVMEMIPDLLKTFHNEG